VRRVVLAVFALVTLCLAQAPIQSRPVAAQGAPVTLRLSPREPTVGVNSSVVVDVIAENAGNLYGVDLQISFDASRLEASALTVGALLPDAYVSNREVDNSTGKLRLVATLLGDTERQRRLRCCGQCAAHWQGRRGIQLDLGQCTAGRPGVECPGLAAPGRPLAGRAAHRHPHGDWNEDPHPNQNPKPHQNPHLNQNPKPYQNSKPHQDTLSDQDARARA